MAFLDVHAFSDVLGVQVGFYVLLPQRVRREIGVEGGTDRTSYPVLWLLHGLSDDHTIWLRRTGIERYAAEKNIAVVMPAVGRSFYQDMASGPRYWTFISEELPELCRRWFPISSRREENFVAGLSMGGYGAFRLALARPESYAAAASLSGALDLLRRLRDAGREGSRVSRAEWEGVFGPQLSAEGTTSDLGWLARSVSAKQERPELFLACGTEDELLGDSRAFHQLLDQLGYEHVYRESPGSHEWDYWDRLIQQVLDWLPLPRH